MELNERPLYKLIVQGMPLWGLLDSGADCSIIKNADWPKAWMDQHSTQVLRGLGYAQDPECSASFLTWKDEEGHSGIFQPFVLSIPISLWGRDVMKQMGITLTTDNCYSPQSKKIMSKMGYRPGKGLGLREDGRRLPISAQGNIGRQGLGFS
ncbi:endogenous retrovirus group K member 18 Pro protein-like [Nannospalax galili]|uniref:endogenous retrovirus group K member 18 Pro protein-like n=1 Tax=Nannospalax galili TaxID=1026970 RepID=UPI000819F404|nr:endogenous retrovirus group K member 18 Pro protein-like [Nannospalax galili]